LNFCLACNIHLFRYVFNKFKRQLPQSSIPK
jgi:hypothetical protein